MSRPSNPLSKFISYETKHILIAFNNSDAACAFSLGTGKIGKAGEPVFLKEGNGEAFVAINEEEDPTFFISDLQWSFDFFSPVAPQSTACVGNFSVAAGPGGVVFPNHLRNIAKKLKISIYHIPFYLVTVFRGILSNGNVKTITTKPLIINIVDSHNTAEDRKQELYTYDFVAQYNTLGQLPQFADLSQITITHQDGSLGQSIPTAEGATFGVQSRKEENKIKNIVRRARLARSKPMTNLRDVFNGLEQELKSQSAPNRRQLQELMALVRDDYVKKIKEPKQKKDDIEGIRLDYRIVLDSSIARYPIDNRNLPFEQPDQSQTVKGINTFTLPVGSNIMSAVTDILRLSAKMGDDALNLGYSFKTTVTTTRNQDGKYESVISIYRYVTPRNTVDGRVNTAPGNGAVKGPLKFAYGEGNKEDFDIISLVMTLGPDVDVKVLEDDNIDDGGDANVVYGNREQISIERSPGQKFDHSFYSGMRGLAANKNYGLESGSKAAAIDLVLSRFVACQTSLTVIDIAGNCDLYSDLCRNPKEVAEGKHPDAVLYRYPEYEPMYVELSVRIKEDSATNKKVNSTEQNYFYYKGPYHLVGVTNTFHGSTFLQSLRLVRTDDS